MDLVLWRHAEAIDLELVGDDLLRTLTPKGEKQALRMGAWLDRQLPAGTRVFCSPALRADQTVRALDRKYKTSPALAPLASVDDLLALVHWPDASGCVLVIGHQPILGRTISRVLGLKDPDCSVKKGAIWWLRTRDTPSGMQTNVMAVLSPEVL